MTSIVQGVEATGEAGHIFVHWARIRLPILGADFLAVEFCVALWEIRIRPAQAQSRARSVRRREKRDELHLEPAHEQA